jgi:hypothetical protein
MMSFRLRTLQVCRATVTLALVGLLVCSVHAAGRQRGRPIEFSVPRSDEVTTNLHQLTNKKDGLKQLEEDLYKPLQSFTPKSSLEGVVAPSVRPPSQSVIQNKRVKELLERRKNWVFMTPEDLLGGPTVDEILKTPQFGADGQEKKEPQTFERYYQRLAAKRPAANKPSKTKDDELFGPPRKSNPQDEPALSDGSELPSGLRESAEALNNLFEPGGSDSPFARATTHGSFSDTFGLGANTLSKERMQEHKKFMDEYRSVVDPSWRPPAVATPGNPLVTVADTAPTVGKPAAGLPGSSSPAPHRGLDAQSDVINPLLGPAGLPDVNALALGQTRPTPGFPKVESTRVAPVAPTFTAPKRSFR